VPSLHERNPAAVHAPIARGGGGADDLYLRALSTGDLLPALQGLLGEYAAELSATNIARLTARWEALPLPFDPNLTAAERLA
jgi:hypothetical protein